VTASDLPEALLASIVFPANSKRLMIAYSGGLDSHVLLHLFSAAGRHFRQQLIAVHVNHGLSDNASQWARHCESICADLAIPFNLIELDARPPTGESPEAWARELRYAAIQNLMQSDDVLLTAHHLDDMAETLLIQLLRGAGPAGLASMPETSRFGQGWHYRPLLHSHREQLHAYAQQHALQWIEDESNAETRYDRNYLRQAILPSLKKRWPAIATTLTRAAKHQADAAALLDDLASLDLQTCASDSGPNLSVPALLELSRARAANTLRYWIRQQGFATPTERQLSQVFTDILPAQPDSEPCVNWLGAELRRYRDRLFIIAPLPARSAIETVIDWQLDQPCELALGTLTASRNDGIGIKADHCSSGTVTVRFRQGGEQIRKGGHHHDLKKLCQQYGIPSCYRDYIPLLYMDDTLVALAGILVDEQFAAKPADAAWQIHWSYAGQVCLSDES
jgi:tRNA(Ile)-lysidine synthase